MSQERSSSSFRIRKSTRTQNKKLEELISEESEGSSDEAIVMSSFKVSEVKELKEGNEEKVTEKVTVRRKSLAAKKEVTENNNSEEEGVRKPSMSSIRKAKEKKVSNTLPFNINNFHSAETEILVQRRKSLSSLQNQNTSPSADTQKRKTQSIAENLSLLAEQQHSPEEKDVSSLSQLSDSVTTYESTGSTPGGLPFSTFLTGAITIVPLSSTDIKDLYPSDEDMDFEEYLASDYVNNNAKGAVDEDEDETASNRIEEPEQKDSLKFTKYVRNPLYDCTGASQQAISISMTKEEIMRYNEAVLKCIDEGDVKFFHLVAMEKKVRLGKQRRDLTRKISKISLIRREKISKADKRSTFREVEKDSTRRESDATEQEGEEFQHSEKHSYCIKKCSKSWKSQIKSFMDVPQQNIEETSTDSTDKNDNCSKKNQSDESLQKVRVLPFQYPSSACSINGYIPEWKYTMIMKRVVDNINVTNA